MSDGASPADAPTATSPAAPINCLSVAHLLLWLAMTSAVLACEQRVGSEFPFADNTNWDVNAPPELFAIRVRWKLTRALHLTIAPVSGAALAGGALAIWRRVRRQPGFPAQPGHWLLMIMAAQYVVSVGEWSANDLTTWLPWDAVISTLYALPAGVAFVAALRSYHWHWRGPFALIALGYCGFAIGRATIYVLRNIAVFEHISLFSLIPGFVVMGAFVGGLASSAWDLWLRERRDIFHWIGVGVLLAVTAELVAVFVIWR